MKEGWGYHINNSGLINVSTFSCIPKTTIVN